MISPCICMWHARISRHAVCICVWYFWTCRVHMCVTFLDAPCVSTTTHTCRTSHHVAYMWRDIHHIMSHTCDVTYITSCHMHVTWHTSHHVTCMWSDIHDIVSHTCDVTYMTSYYTYHMQVMWHTSNHVTYVWHTCFHVCAYMTWSDPPHKIMRYWFYYSISWFFQFHLTTLVRWKWFVTQLYQFRRGILGEIGRASCRERV